MLRNLAIAVLMIFMTGTVGAAQWEIDKAHSSIGFTVKHLVVSKVNGSFGDFSGSIAFEPGQLQNGTVKIAAKIASVDTNDPKRDDHLRSPDFFDAATFPEMTFVSKKVHDVDGNEFKITGDLTIRDVTKEVVFDCVFNGVVNDPWGNTKAGFSATAKINRQDFGVKWNKSLDAGGVVVGDEVTMNIELELGKAK